MIKATVATSRNIAPAQVCFVQGCVVDAMQKENSGDFQSGSSSAELSVREATGARRIEAGLLNAGSDFDQTLLPFAAGLGTIVNMDKQDFIGKAALQRADQRRRTWGLRVPGGVAQIGNCLSKDGAPAGQVCSTAWYPFQQCGVAVVRLDEPTLGPGTILDVECNDEEVRPAETRDLPMYDRDRQIPRGKLVDIPDIPGGGEAGSSDSPEGFPAELGRAWSGYACHIAIRHIVWSSAVEHAMKFFVRSS